MYIYTDTVYMPSRVRGNIATVHTHIMTNILYTYTYKQTQLAYILVHMRT